MDDDQITALAREYAEEITKGNLSEGEEVPEYIIKTISKEAVTTLTWLLRRYCLVEKEEAKQFFQSRQNILANQDKYDRYIVDEASAEKRLMLCLFPEIAKEVE